MQEELVLIDFGCAKIFPSTAMFSFDKQPFSFSGNFLYASHNAFQIDNRNPNPLTRRDDLISLAYMLTSLIQDDLEWTRSVNRYISNYNKVGLIKRQLTPEKVCQNQAHLLLSFVQEVFEIEYYEEPCYSKLKFMLVSVLLNQGISPDSVFDWSYVSNLSTRPPELRLTQGEENVLVGDEEND